MALQPVSMVIVPFFSFDVGMSPSPPTSLSVVGVGVLVLLGAFVVGFGVLLGALVVGFGANLLGNLVVDFGVAEATVVLLTGTQLSVKVDNRYRRSSVSS